VAGVGGGAGWIGKSQNVCSVSASHHVKRDVFERKPLSFNGFLPESVVRRTLKSKKWQGTMDKILIKDLRVTGIIGIYEHERHTPQEMVINLTLFTDIRRAAETDDIADCVDYEKVANAVKAHAETSQRLTVEALAEDLARLCLQTSGVRRVIVRVEKTQAIPFTAAVGVEIDRKSR
jgi:FolB domain-containing protein